MQSKKYTALANITLFLVAIIWGGGFVAGKMAISGTTPFAVLVYRFGVSALLTFVVFFKRIIRCDPDTVKKGLASECCKQPHWAFSLPDSNTPQAQSNLFYAQPMLQWFRSLAGCY